MERILLSVLPAAAFALDAVFGDPHSVPHPVVLIGAVISHGEKLLRNAFRKTPRAEFAAGTILALFVVSAGFLVPFLLLMLLYRLNFFAGFAAELLFCYQILAAKSLKTESMKVYGPLKSGGLPRARAFLSRIVGRDTGRLDAAGVARAAVETVAENTSDGVIAPLAYMALGGAPLGFFYKAVNTLDSMIGYRSKKYLYFGRFAAKLDDAANFVPSRLSALLMIAAARLLRNDAKNAARIFRRDRNRPASPNSGQTESVCAGALDIRLGGNAYYFGELYEKPTLGDPLRPVEPEDIARANRLMTVTSVLGTALACLVRAALSFAWR